MQMRVQAGFDAYLSVAWKPQFKSGSEWEKRYFALMDAILSFNRNNPFQRKHVILIVIRSDLL